MGKVKCKRAMRRVANIVTMIANDKEKTSATIAQRGARKGALRSGLNPIDKEKVALMKATKKAILAKAKLSANKVNKNKKLNNEIAELASKNAKAGQAYLIEKRKAA